LLLYCKPYVMNDHILCMSLFFLNSFNFFFYVIEIHGRGFFVVATAT
jgi:hypothetical protein